MIEPVPRPGLVDKILSPEMLLRFLGAVLLLAGLVLAFRGSWGYFSGTTALLGLPAGLGLLLLNRRWGRPLGLLFFIAWGVLGLVLIGFGQGRVGTNLSLFLGGLVGGWSVFRWTD